MALWSLLLLAGASAVLADTFSITSESVTYVSGNAVTAGADFNETLWHEVSSSPLVVNIKLTHDGSNLNIPTSTFMSVSGVHKSVGSTVVISAPKVNNTASSVSWDITFRTTTYGKYEIKYSCTDLEDTQGRKGSPSGYCGTKTVLVGYKPSVRLVEKVGTALTTVTNAWLNPEGEEYYVSVSPSNDASFKDTTAPAYATAFTVVNADGEEDAVSPDFESGTRESTAEFRYKLKLSDASPGTFTVTVEPGAFLRAEGTKSGVGNFEITYTIRVGWLPAIEFYDVKRAHMDDSAAADSEGSFWFRSGAPADTASEVVLQIGIPAALEESVALSNTTMPNYGAAAGQLLAATNGVTLTSGNKGKFNSTSQRYVYALNTASLIPGVYNFDIPQGVLVDITGKKYNAAKTGKLRVGFVPTMSVFNGDSDVTSEWLDPAGEKYTVVVRPNAGSLFADATAPAETCFEFEASGNFAINASTAATTKSVTYPLGLGTAGTTVVTVKQGQFARSGGVKNTFTTLKVQTGFAPDLSFVDSTDDTVEWFSTQTSAVKFVVAAGADVADAVLSATAPVYGTKATQLFAGASSLPGSRIVSGGIKATSTAATISADNYTYAININDETNVVPPGVYTFNVPQGVIEIADADGNKIRNYPVSAKLQVGFIPELFLLEDDVDVTNDWIDGRNSEHFLMVTPGLGYSFDDSVFDDFASTSFKSDDVDIDAEVSTSDHTHIKYKIASKADLPYGVLPVKLADSLLLRSDSIKNAPVTLNLKSGFVPTVSFVSGSIADASGNDTDDVWFNSAKTGVKLTVEAPDSVTFVTSPVPAYSIGGIFNGMPSLPGSSGRVGGVTLSGTPTASTTAFEYSLVFGGITPGQYPFEIAQGSFSSATAKNARVVNNLKIGYTPSLSYVDADGKDVTTAWIHPNRTVYFTVGVSAESAAVSALYRTVSAEVPEYKDVVDADTTGTDIAITSTGFAERTASTFMLKYPLNVELDAGKYDLKLNQNGNVICNGEEDEKLICVASEMTAPQLYIGFIPTGHTYSAARPDSDYLGMLDADNKIADETRPIPCLDKAVKVEFNDLKGLTGVTTSAAAWAAIITATAGLQVPNSVTVGTDKITYSFDNLANTAPGVYDITLNSGVFTDSGNKNAPVTVRLIVGVDVGFMTADTRVDESTGKDTKGSAIYQRYTNGPFVTSASDVIFRVHGFGIGSWRLTELLQDVIDSKGNKVKFALTGLNESPLSRYNQGSYRKVDYKIGIAGLADGVYTFRFQGDAIFPDGDETATTVLNTITDIYDKSDNLRDQSVVLIVDRTAPTISTADLSYAGSPVFTGVPFPAGEKLPATLFKDVGSPGDFIEVSLASVDDRGITLHRGQNAKAFLGSATFTTFSDDVRRPSGLAKYTVTATDEAGNKATANFQIQIRDRATGSLTAVDVARKVQSRTTLFTGSSITKENTLKLEIISDWDAAVTGVTSASLKCTIGSVACGASPSLVTVPTTAGNRRYTWSITLTSNDINAVKNTNNTVTFNLATDKVKSAVGTYPVNVPAPVQVRIDTQKPSVPGSFTPSSKASVGVRYTVTLPTNLFRDSVSTPDKIRLISASPSSQFGLSFTAGQQGSAVISGLITAQPPKTDDYKVRFDITAEDEAGNRVTAKNAVVIPIEVFTSVPTFSLAADILRFTENGDATPIDANAKYSWIGNSPDAIKAYLIPRETDEVVGEVTRSEKLIALEKFEDLNATYVVEPTTNEGILTLVVPEAVTLKPAEVLEYIRSIHYSNERESVISGSRTVRIDLLKNAAVVGTFSRLVRVTAVNDIPVIAGVNKTVNGIPIAYDEQDGGSNDVFATLEITDEDDVDMSSAIVTIANVDGTGYTKCDPVRDVLTLSAAYRKRVSSTVLASWSSRACTLTLRPAEPLISVPIAEMQKALRSVVYMNLDSDNPTNGSADTVTRMISVIVEDAGSGGRLPNKGMSEDVNAVLLDIIPEDDLAVIDKRMAFGDNGFLSSVDPFANIKTFNDDTGVIKEKKFAVVLPSLPKDEDDQLTEEGTALSLKNTVFTISLDLRKVSNGVFAKGAIVDPDTYELPLSSLKIFANSTGVELSSLATVDSDIFTTDANGQITIDSNFEASATDLSVFTLVVRNDVADDKLGERKFVFQFADDVTLDFYVDIRRKACTLAGADNAVSKEVMMHFYPDNSLCKYPAVEVSASSTEAAEVARGGYTALRDSLALAAKNLATLGASKQAQIAALKELRSAARGAFGVTIAAGSLASRGSMSFEAKTADSKTRTLLPVVDDADAEVDFDMSIRLTPPGTTFSTPVKICLFVGDTSADFYRVLKVASQRDPGDQTKGYKEWSILKDQTFNIATGEVCGYTDHFSVVAPFTLPQPVSPTVPKAHLMGGSCPNQCSNHGTCRQEGQCVCFPGFEGYDCSLRVCPSAESWGEYQSTMHSQSECAGRGVCDRVTGTCKCFDGFEGAACERTKCPNDCSGHGKCRTLSELPNVQAAGYASWEAKRVQVCQCDGGYTGADCSLRLCPEGDDPETVCAYDQRQVQRVTLYFEQAPTSDGILNIDADSNEFALIFRTSNGKNFTTPMISDIWSGSATTSNTITEALQSLPEFAVTEVEVTGSQSSLAVSYDITMSGSTNSGNQLLIACPVNSEGSYGCTAPGCRPKFKQVRILSVDGPASSAVKVSDLTILRQPEPLDNTADETTPATWGVETTLIITKYAVPGSGSPVYTYVFDQTKIYGVDDETANTEETPIPPEALRTSVAGPYGLLIELGSDQQFDVDFSGTGPFIYSFKWRLPKCKVEEITAADIDYERSECSGRGLCNREAGECECFNGYTGFNCAQQTVYV